MLHLVYESKHVNISNAASSDDESISDSTVPSRTSEPSNYPDSLTNSNAFVIVHGYNPNSDKASENQEIQRGFYSELFKRMHQTGSRSQFVGLTWHSATGKDYHKAAYNAFKSSEVLKNELSFLTGEITIAAHSLGNVLVSNAVAHESFGPRNYFMINSASPIEAYEAAQVIDSDDQEMTSRMIEKLWKPYHSKLHSNTWPLLFPADDGRSKLTWRNRFKAANAVTHLVNFYSTGEDVVANAKFDEIDIAKHAWNTYITGEHRIGRYAWVNQEFIKGGTSFGSFLFEYNHAGWGWLASEGTTPSHYMLGQSNPLNNAGSFSRYSADESKLKIANGEITDEHLAQFHYFKPFSAEYAVLSAPIDDAYKTWRDPFGAWHNPHSQSDASDLANKKDTQWRMLASAMASSTGAAAANDVIGVDGHNMMELKNGWPEGIGRTGKYSEDWQHSDFHVISYSYVYRMFEKMVEEGKLK